MRALVNPHREGTETPLQALERIVEQWDLFTAHPTHWHRIQAALMPHFVASSKAGVDKTIADTCERLLREHSEMLATPKLQRQLSLFAEAP